MTDLANNLISILNMEDLPPAIVEDTPTTLPAVIEDDAPTAENDINFARTNIRTVILDSVASIQELIKIAKDSEHPRAYEVLATFIKTFAELNTDLVNLHTKKKALEVPAQTPQVQAGNTNMHIEKAVFTGSTADLASIIKKQLKNASDIPK